MAPLDPEIPTTSLMLPSAGHPPSPANSGAPPPPGIPDRTCPRRRLDVIRRPRPEQTQGQLSVAPEISRGAARPVQGQSEAAAIHRHHLAVGHERRGRPPPAV